MGRIFQRDGRYGIDYVTYRGRRVRRMVSGDKSIAAHVLAQEIAANERLKAGILTVDPRETKRPIRQHVDAYLADLARRGRDSMYLYTIRRHLEAAIKAQKWTHLLDCTTRSIGQYLQKLADEDLAPKTLNGHRADVSAFLGWCVRQNVLETNPCAQVQKASVRNVKTRRALSIDELGRLLDAAPPDRRLAYLFLMYTGLRRAEAAALCWGDVHLAVANPFVELSADITKSGRPESVPLVPDVAEALTACRGRAKDGDHVFDAIPSMPKFRADLAAAGIEEVDSRGRKVVLHSLRHSLATMLAQSHVPPAVAQRIMRHRDIRLTMEVYTDEALLPLAAAMNSLPSVSAGAGAPGASHLGIGDTDGARNVPTRGHDGTSSGTRADGASRARRA